MQSNYNCKIHTHLDPTPSLSHACCRRQPLLPLPPLSALPWLAPRSSAPLHAQASTAATPAPWPMSCAPPRLLLPCMSSRRRHCPCFSTRHTRELVEPPPRLLFHPIPACLTAPVPRASLHCYCHSYFTRELEPPAGCDHRRRTNHLPKNKKSQLFKFTISIFRLINFNSSPYQFQPIEP